MDDHSISERVSKHRERMVSRFGNPQTRHFTHIFGISLPDSLERLYSLREKLFTTFNEHRDAADGDIPVRDFAPLSHEAIDYCDRFEFRFYSFGTGHDGEDLLIGFDTEDQTYVHWGDPNELPEQIQLPFSELVDRTFARIAKLEENRG